MTWAQMPHMVGTPFGRKGPHHLFFWPPSACLTHSSESLSRAEVVSQAAFGGLAGAGSVFSSMGVVLVTGDAAIIMLWSAQILPAVACEELPDLGIHSTHSWVSVDRRLGL